MFIDYDRNGNLTQDAEGEVFVFNGDNKQRLVAAVGTNVGEYFYDGEGKRVKKKVYESNGVDVKEETVFVYSGGKLVAEFSTKPVATNPTTSYTATDQLGSPRVITDSKGDVISRRDFMPFGEEIINNTGERQSANTSGIQAPVTDLKYNAPDSLRQKFTGYQKDEETSLDFAEARMYENRHGRFTAVDPLLASGRSPSPQSFNRYVYVQNSPIIKIDPTGLFDWFSQYNSTTNQTEYKWSKDNKTFKDGSSVDGWTHHPFPEYGEIIVSGACSNADCTETSTAFLRQGGKVEFSGFLRDMRQESEKTARYFANEFGNGFPGFRQDWDLFWSNPLGETGLGNPALTFALAGNPVGSFTRSGATSTGAMINSPFKGYPPAIEKGFASLSKNQASVLSQLTEYGSSTIVPKSMVGTKDLAALTAQTGDEFAMFTTGGRRMIMRGDFRSVPISPEIAGNMSRQGWRWSAHTQPGVGANFLMPSPGDISVLRATRQSQSLILNSTGQWRVFGTGGTLLTGWLP